MRKLPTLQALARLVRFANAYSVHLLSLLLTQGCSNPWARITKRLRRSTQDNTFSTQGNTFSTQGNAFRSRLPTLCCRRSRSKELKMPSEMEIFQQDLLKSVKQMRRGQAARVTRVKVPQAAEARSRVGLSQQDFARLLGVSARTLYRIRNRVVENQPEQRRRSSALRLLTPRCSSI